MARRTTRGGKRVTPIIGEESERALPRVQRTLAELPESSEGPREGFDAGPLADPPPPLPRKPRA